MACRVLVFSADELRGKIVNKVLIRNGFDCRIFNRILEAGGAIAEHAPGIVILDTESCFSEEINHLRSICRTLKRSFAIVLGEASVIDGFKGQKTLCLPDPVDPELIITKAKQIISQQQQKKKKKKERCTGSDTLEKTLKEFLNID